MDVNKNNANKILMVVLCIFACFTRFYMKIILVSLSHCLRVVIHPNRESEATRGDSCRLVALESSGNWEPILTSLGQLQSHFQQPPPNLGGLIIRTKSNLNKKKHSITPPFTGSPPTRTC